MRGSTVQSSAHSPPRTPRAASSTFIALGRLSAIFPMLNATVKSHLLERFSSSKVAGIRILKGV
jgi:hypothetical protein